MIKKQIENNLLKITETKRSDYTEPLWENDTFLENIFYCGDFKYSWYSVLDLIPPNKFAKLHIVHAAVANCLRNHYTIFLDDIYERVPSEKWNDMNFCGFLVNLHHSAIKYVSEELKMKKEIFFVACEAVPEMNDYDEYAYFNSFSVILKEIPDSLKKDEEFKSKILEIITKVYEGTNASFDLEELKEMI